MLVLKAVIHNQFIRVSRGGKNIKIHAVVDGSSNPLQFIISDDQLHDSKAAIELLSKIEISGSNVLADRVYGTDEIRTYISENNADYTIHPKSNNTNPWH